jgi:hypothetical protein|tara:strand:- start:204 stop:743 length:540 start_codon:yes stop_codon:yes gene_type:complete
MIGNSQMLNLPVSDAIILWGGDEFTVPAGKILQVVSSTHQNNGIKNAVSIKIKLNNNISSVYNYMNNPVYPSGTIIENLYAANPDYYLTCVLYDLDSQNLASNVPQQTTPTLYPYPTSSLLALNSDKEYDIEVYDMAGNKVMALTGNTIDMSHLSSATYIVKALDKVENEEVSYKVVKN